MKKSRVISYRNLPTKLPFLATAITYLLLDKFNTPDWVWGTVITLLAIHWILCIVAIANNQTTVDIFNNDKD